MAQFKLMRASSAFAQLERLGVVKVYDDITSQTYEINKTATLTINGYIVKIVTYDIYTAEYICYNLDGTTQSIRHNNDINVEYKH
jgi:hypothetical protein